MITMDMARRSQCRLHSLLCVTTLLLAVPVQAQTTAATTTTQSTTDIATSTTSTATPSTESTTSILTPSTAATTTSSNTVTISTTSPTGTTTATQSSTTSLPSLTTSSTTSTSETSAASTNSSPTTTAGLTNAPTLSGIALPTLQVPDTSSAPFMQKSSLLEGTVFICVGAALGFLGLCILAWRGWVAWSLNRSVQRAARSYRSPDSKAGYGRYRGRGRGPYGGSGGDVSMEHLTGVNTASTGAGTNAGVKERSHRREKTKGQQSRTQTASALFFSPTAGAANSAFHQPSNRASGYLPAGYYASGSIAPAAKGYGRLDDDGISPPDTPGSRPSPVRQVSSGRQLDSPTVYTSRSNLGGGAFDLEMPGQRAPSAVLDSWFEHSTAMGRADRL